MERIKKEKKIPLGKRVPIIMLYVFASFITLTGVAFGAYSQLAGVKLTVMTAQIPGIIFGAVIAFLGVRYFLSVRKLQKKVYDSKNEFSLANFRRGK